MNAPLILWNEQSSCWDSFGQNCDADCACPLKPESRSTIDLQVISPVLKQSRVFMQEIANNSILMLNLVSSGGVVVVNASAYGIWQEFQTPRALNDLPVNVIPFARDMAQAGLLEPVSYDSVLPPRRSAPKTLSTWIHVTNECNLRCDYCYIRKTEDDMPEDVGRAAVDAIFRSAEKHGFHTVKLKFAGGEATMNLKRVFDIHNYALQKSAQMGIATDAVVLSNGVSIGPRAIEQFEQRGIRVSISLDGVGEAHDAQRRFANGRGSFTWVDRTIEKLIARGIRPFISITLSGRNAAALPETIRYVAERDLPFNINFYRENDCAAPFADLRLQDDRIIEAMRAAFAVLEANLPSRSLLGSLVDRAQFDQPHEKTCGVGDSYIIVDHKGKVAKCQMEIERPVSDVWAEDPLFDIRADKTGIQNLNVEEKEGCKTCEWKYWCAGGCPALTFRATGRYDVKSPNCRIYKALYPELLRLEGLRLMKLSGIPII